MYQRRVLAVCLSLLLAVALGLDVRAAAPGHLNGTVRDESGAPLANLLVALVSRSSDMLPILTRTAANGRLLFQNLEQGLYEVRVASSSYVSPRGRLVEIESGQTASVKLVLQRLLTLAGTEQENLSLKSLLRYGSGSRLVFRGLDPPVGGDFQRGSPLFEKAALDVFSSTGMGAVPSPGGALGGTTTNFAVSQSILGPADYRVAGQFSSGVDSSWKIKNFFDYSVGDHQNIRVFLGYGHLTPEQASLGLVGQEVAGARTPGAATTRLFSVGVEDELVLHDSLSMTWGVEVDHVRTHASQYRVSPNARVEYSPRAGSMLRLRLASRRQQRSNMVMLPDSEPVDLSDSVHLYPLGDQLQVGTARHLEAAFWQALGRNTEVEVAAFQNAYQGAARPLLAFTPGQSQGELLPLQGEDADSRGYRVSLNRQLGANLRASVSYVRAQATGLAGEATEVLIVDPATLSRLFRRQGFHAFVTQLEAFVPASNTQVTALIKTVSDGQPLFTLDALSDFLDTSNQGVHLFVRQLLPVPDTLFGLVDLDFLSSYRIEILFDVRNLTNEQLALLRGSSGDLRLIQNPRSFRGGISLRF